VPAARRRRRGDFGPCKVVILAGGFGTRLAEHTDDIPKPMVQVGGRPILWHILKIYSHFGFNDFLIATGYKSDVIKRFFLEYREQASDLIVDFPGDRITRINPALEQWRVAVIDTGGDTMTGGRIKRLKAHLDTRVFLLTYGDGVADVDLRALLKFHASHKKLATFTAVARPEPFGLPTFDGDRVTGFAEKPRGQTQWINGGFLALQPRVLNYIKDDTTSFEADVLSRLARDGELMAFRHRGFWHPMDTLRDVRTLNSLWANDDAPWKVWP
jgi:glucose-1-phosphate cytidylyltransferase